METNKFALAIVKAGTLAELIGKVMEDSDSFTVGTHTKWAIKGTIPGREVTVEYVTGLEVPASIIEIFSGYCAETGATMTISQGGTLSARFQA